MNSRAINRKKLHFNKSQGKIFKFNVQKYKVFYLLSTVMSSALYLEFQYLAQKCVTLRALFVFESFL